MGNKRWNAEVIDLGAHRSAVLGLTYALGIIARATGAGVTTSQPGVVHIALSEEGSSVELRVRVVRHSDAAVAALYKRHGIPPPARLTHED